MKRIHLFEFEDLPGFPPALRRCMTLLIMVMHRLLDTKTALAGILAEILAKTKSSKIIDLCSGSGGPMPQVLKLLEKQHGYQNLHLTLTDFYPDQATVSYFNNLSVPIYYQTYPVDATALDEAWKGIRTLVAGFHHFKPSDARKILLAAQKSKQPICILEISDNSYPKWLWWTAIPINLLTCLFITPMVRPMSWQQLVFTYLIPIIPLCFAWDGAVSNARTYTLADLDELLAGLKTPDYHWKKGVVKGKSKKLYLIGLPG